MTAEDYIKNMNQSPQPTRQQIRRARVTAVVLAVLIVTSILFFMYGFLQKTEADRLRKITEAVQQEAVQQQKLAEKAYQEADQQRDITVKALTALEECKKNKK